MAKTFGEIFHDRIAPGLSTEDIRQRYRAMVTDTIADGGDEEIARQNLGYILGYFDPQTRQEWYAALPEVSHPVFGSEFGRGYEPTPEEAFALGQQLAKGAVVLERRGMMDKTDEELPAKLNNEVQMWKAIAGGLAANGMGILVELRKYQHRQVSEVEQQFSYFVEEFKAKSGMATKP